MWELPHRMWHDSKGPGLWDIREEMCVLVTVLGKVLRKTKDLLLLCASCLSSTAYGPLLGLQILEFESLSLNISQSVCGWLFYLLHVRHQAGTTQGLHNCSLPKWGLIFLHSIVPLLRLNYIYLSIAPASSFTLVSLAFAVSNIYK